MWTSRCNNKKSIIIIISEVQTGDNVRIHAWSYRRRIQISKRVPNEPKLKFIKIKPTINEPKRNSSIRCFNFFCYFRNISDPTIVFDHSSVFLYFGDTQVKELASDTRRVLQPGLISSRLSNRLVDCWWGRWSGGGGPAQRRSLELHNCSQAWMQS